MVVLSYHTSLRPPITRFGENVLDYPVGPNVIIKGPIRDGKR